MSSSELSRDKTQVTLRPVDRDNWREVTKIKVAEPQREFVAEPSYYLALCCFGGDWQPLAIYLGEQVIGFLMWAVDPADKSCWLGGILIDQNYQKQGHGRQAIQLTITMLSETHGHQDFALSYNPENPARRLYQALGFKETKDWEEDEVIARLSLAGKEDGLP